ncbi:MAG TPA: amidophosphoribosyltransferase [Acidimicrobiales bacterium]|nr:amidophosphoribosyltransferase [Acidimicrobiales bacterium]
MFGVYAPGVEVAPLVFDGLFALQHRGQESAGMAVSDGETVTVVKDMGLVTSVFGARSLSPLQGHLGLGHVRYSTSGASTWQSAQPVYRSVGAAGFALGHNGNLTNVPSLEDGAGLLPGVLDTDSDVIAELVAREMEAADPAAPDALERALAAVLPELEGAFSLGLIDAGHLVAVRDPNGFRPLCLGRIDLPGGEASGPEVIGPEPRYGYVVASESPALDIVGARFVREIEPGEMLVVDAAGCRSSFPFPPERVEPAMCVFEFVYFARPDTRLRGREVHAARRRMGEHLALESPARADLVIGVPDSGVPAAEGYAARSGIPFGHGLVKNRYIGRTFIAPSPEARREAVRRKLNPLPESIEGRRLVVVDDSIVRGTTIRRIIEMLREAGALEVHLRVSSPPFRWPCFYGIDTPSRAELLAAGIPPAEVAGELTARLGADSVGYLSLESMIAAIGAGEEGWCTACQSGVYPTPVPLDPARRLPALAR